MARLSVSQLEEWLVQMWAVEQSAVLLEPLWEEALLGFAWAASLEVLLVESLAELLVESLAELSVESLAELSVESLAELLAQSSSAFPLAFPS